MPLAAWRGRPVAVAIGQAKLKIWFSEPDGGLAVSEVYSADAQGKYGTKPLKSGDEIETPPDRITEVAVRFQGKKTAGAVAVTVEPV